MLQLNKERGLYLLGQFDLEVDAEKHLKQVRESEAARHEQENEFAVGDRTNQELDLHMVREARRAEIEYIRRMNLYTKVSLSECVKETSKKPIAGRLM